MRAAGNVWKASLGIFHICLLLTAATGLLACLPAGEDAIAAAAAGAPRLTESPAEVAELDGPPALTSGAEREAGPAQADGEAAPNPPPGGEVVAGGLRAPDTLNPWLAESDAARALVPLVFQSLASPDPDDGTLRPKLAASWHISEDGKTVTFALDPQARWANGLPVSPQDVVFSLTAVQDDGLDSLYGVALRGVVDVTASGGHSVTVSTADGDCRLVTSLTRVPIVPAGWALTRTLTFSDTGDVVWGSGPFGIESANPEGVVLVKNPAYWGEAAHVDSLIYRPYRSTADLLVALESGGVDLAWLGAAELLGTEVQQSTEGRRLVTFPASENVFVAYNTENDILADGRVRQALSLALDRGLMMEQALNGRGELAGGSLPPHHWAAGDVALPPQADRERALTLLAEAGWKDSDGDGWLDGKGGNLVLPVRTNEENAVRSRVAALVAAAYRGLGIRAEVQLVPWQIFADDLLTHDYGVAVFGWPMGLDPDQTELWSSSEATVDVGLNVTSMADDDVDRLLEEARYAPGCDPVTRADLYGDLEGAMNRTHVVDFLLAPHDALLLGPDVGGVEVGAFGGPFGRATEWFAGNGEL